MKLAALIWILLGTVMAGVAMTVIVSVPSLYDQGMKLIPIACTAAAVVAIPISIMIARKIENQIRISRR